MKKLIILILFSAIPAFAQGVRYDSIAFAQGGKPLSGATITVCTSAGAGTPCTPLASIYTNQALTTTQSNPFTADSNGNYGFWAAPGTYFYSITGTGITGFSGYITLSSPNAALKPAASEAYVYVSPLGTDSPTCGLSANIPACATLSQAYTNLPSTGGTIRVLGPSYSFSTGIVFSTVRKSVWIDCVGTSNATNTLTDAAVILNYTGASGTALTFNNYTAGMQGCALVGPGTGSSIGIQLGGIGGGLVNAKFSRNTISGFPGGGILAPSGSATIENIILDQDYVHDNGGTELTISVGLEKFAIIGGIYTEGSSFNPSCINFTAAQDFSAAFASFDQCGMTFSGTGPALVTLFATHHENPNASITQPFITLSGNAEFLRGVGLTMAEDNAGSSSPEMISSTGSNDEIWLDGGRFAAAASMANVINASGSNNACSEIGAQISGITAMCSSANSNANQVLFDKTQNFLGWANPLTLGSSGGGKVSLQAPNTASPFIVTLPGATGTIPLLNLANTWTAPQVISQTGTFSGASNNYYAESLLSSCNPSTELAAASGTNPGHVTESITGCINAGTAPPSQANGIGGYAVGSGGSIAGGFFQAHCTGTGSACFGGGTTVVDNTGLGVGSMNQFSGFNINVDPLGNSVSNYTNGVAGQVSTLFAPNVPTNAVFAGASYISNLFAGSKGIWGAGYVSADKSTNIGLVLGTQSGTPPSINSQTIQFGYIDSGSVEHSIFNAIYVDSSGRVTFTPDLANIVVNQGVSPKAILSFSGNTAQRNYTFPDSGGNVAVANSATLQLFNTATTCTTAATAGATCTTAAITLPVAEPDASYRVICQGKGATNVPVDAWTTNSSATQFTITIVAITAAAATFASHDCQAGHS